MKLDEFFQAVEYVDFPIEEEITLEKIEKLGPIVKFDETYYPEAMLKKLSKKKKLN